MVHCHLMFIFLLAKLLKYVQFLTQQHIKNYISVLEGGITSNWPVISDFRDVWYDLRCTEKKR